MNRRTTVKASGNNRLISAKSKIMHLHFRYLVLLRDLRQCGIQVLLVILLWLYFRRVCKYIAMASILDQYEQASSRSGGHHSHQAMPEPVCYTYSKHLIFICAFILSERDDAFCRIWMYFVILCGNSDQRQFSLSGSVNTPLFIVARTFTLLLCSFINTCSVFFVD